MEKQFKYDQTGKFLVIISFISILLALLIIKIVPIATNYEISIYEVYPIYFWILLSIPISMAFLKVIIEDKSDNYTFIAISAALFSLFILLSLPFFRGYLFYGAGDTFTHLGMIKDIAITGHIGLNNPYPIIHLFIFSLSTLTNLTPDTISLFIPSIFIFIFVMAMFLLSKSLGYSKKASLFVMLFSIIPVFGIGLTTEYIMPSLDAFLYIPLVLFIFFESRNSKNKMEFSIILIITLILIAFFHPEPLIFLIIFFIILYFVSYFEKKLNYGFNKPTNLHKQRLFMPILFLTIASLMWFSSTYAFGTSVSQIFNAFVLNLQPDSTPVNTLIGGFHIKTTDVLSIISKEYGVMLIYLIMGFFLTLSTFMKIILKKRVTFLILLLSSVFLAFIVTNLIFLTKGTSIGFSVIRQLKYPLLIVILILGLYFSIFIKNLNLKSISHIIIIVLFVFILPILAITSTYPSPSIQQVNYEPTMTNINGMSFLLDNRNSNIYVSEMLDFSYQTRYADYLEGYESKKTNLIDDYDNNIVGGYTNNSIITLPHFGYNSTNFEIGNYYQKSEYLIMYPPVLSYYPEIYPNYENLWKYNSGDFEILENKNPSVDCLYSNGDFKIFIINPNKS